MVEQLLKIDNNVLVLDAIGGFTLADEMYCQKLFEEKLEQGFDQVNVLVKLDEMKISQSEIKAFFEDFLFIMRNYKKMGHLAIVAHSNILKILVPIDNLFFERASKGRLERYFDVSQMEEALEFVTSNL